MSLGVSQQGQPTVEQVQQADEARPRGRTAAEMLRETPEQINFLVPGLLVPGWLTKLAAREKAGKGTLAYYLLGCLERGDATVFGEAYDKRVTALCLTEEPEESVREKVGLFRVRRARILYGWELASMAWQQKIDWLIEIAVDEGRGLIFVDNISRAASIDEEAGTELARALEYLQDRARKYGVAVLADHHHKKGNAADEDKSRGGTGIAGAADINVEMFRAGTDWEAPERRLTSRGRVRATNWERWVTLSEDGRDYSESAQRSGAAKGHTERAAEYRGAVKALGDGATVSRLVEALEKSESSVKRHTTQLVAAEVLVAVKQQGKATVFAVALEDEQEPEL